MIFVVGMAVDIALIVNGRRYSGFESMRATRTMEGLAGSFALEVSDRWGDDDGDPLPIVEEDACRVEIGEPGKPGTVVIDGYVDGVDIDCDASNRRLSITGKDRAAALVECSATAQGASIKSGAAAGGGDIDPTRHSAESTKWIYTNKNLAEFARDLAKPFGVPVSIQPGLVVPHFPKLIVHPGDTAFEALKRAAEAAGVIVMSDAQGGILITRAGTSRATQLTEGFNILRASVKRDATNRYHRYLISTQIPGSDEASGEATQVQAQAVDEDVRRTHRTILIRPDKGYNTADARRRADWEARIRAAKSVMPSVTVQGWRQPNGVLWPLNALVTVKAPRTIRVDGEMLISEVEYSIGPGPGGQLTRMNLVRPDAFEPEPQATVSGGGAWDELAKGV
jgi:prophage tail gpP-like protein